MPEDKYISSDLIISEQPLVSVIIPVYNVCPYLSECLESVIHQTYQNLEIIIIEDGSTDGSADECDRYAERDLRIRVIHTPNKGLAAARNLGLKHASGTYISFVDSDDWIELHTIDALLKTAVLKNADIVSANIISEFVGKTVYPKVDECEVQIFRGEEILPAYARGLFNEMVWNKLYRLNCFEGISFPDGHNYEDAFTTWKLMKKLASNDKTIAFLNESLFHFRMRRSSISHTRSAKNIMDAWKAYSGKARVLWKYQEYMLPRCFLEVDRMWIIYCDLSRQEKEVVKPTILEMKEFSRRHFHHVMRGEYPLQTKAVCILSQSSSSIMMRFCLFLSKLHQRVRGRKYVMYD